MTDTKRSQGYRFITKDPVVDFIRTIMQDSGLSMIKIADLSGISRKTIYNWEYGSVRRPQNLSITMVMRGLGYSQVWRDANGTELYVPELPKEPAKVVEMPKKKVNYYQEKKTKKRAGR